MCAERGGFTQAQRWVVKIGSALATNDGNGLRLNSIDTWVSQVAALRRSGVEVLIVSSGSIAEGVARLGWRGRPQALHRLQAAAAIGQMGLVRAYESCFQRYGLITAQVLLTHADLSDSRRYFNARETLLSLLQLGAIPVINENDTVATEEIRFGDNDTLAGLVANLVEAGLLVILTDQPGLFERDPRHHPKARMVPLARAGDPALEPMAGEGGALGRGGMRTKLKAAALAARSGTATVIVSGSVDNVLLRIAAGEELGTLLIPPEEPIAARKRWLAGTLHPKGRLVLDGGAVRVLREAGKSLLAVGVTRVDGKFNRGDLVSCVGADSKEVARGLVNYSADEARRIMGNASERIEAILGYVDEAELIHRDNLVLMP